MEFALDATLLGCGVGTATVTLVTYSSRTRLDSITITVEEVEDRLSLPFISNKSGTVGTSLAVQLPEASGGDPPYRYALSGLPTTLTFTESTRRITGTPTTAAEYDLTYTATDDNGNGDSVSETFKLVVANPPLALPTIDDASGTVGTSLTVQLPEASGGDPPYRYALSGLPTTLTFTESTRRITGTPTTAAEYDLTYTATDDNGNGDSVSETFKLVVANPPLALPTIDDASGTVGTSLTVQLPEASGGDPPYRYALSGLPTTLTFTESTRRITGTPTSVAVYDLEYTATDDDGNGDSVSETFKLVVANPPLALPTIDDASGTVGTSLTVQLPEASGGDPPYRYALSGLPTTLTFTESTRRITGTPTTAAGYDLTYTATDDNGSGDSVSETFMLTINSATPPTPSGKLRIVPPGDSTIDVNETVEVEAYDISPSTLEVEIGLAGSLDIDNGRPCSAAPLPNSSTRSVTSWTLRGCEPPGEGSVTLHPLNSDTVLDTIYFTVQAPKPPPPPALSMSFNSSPSQTSPIEVGESDMFDVLVSNSTSGREYRIVASVDSSGSAAGFDSTCSEYSQTSSEFTGASSESRSFTLYGCRKATGLNLVAELQIQTDGGVPDTLVWDEVTTISTSFNVDATHPGVVAKPTVTPAEESLDVGWTAPSYDGGAPITRYEVQYREGASTTWPAVNIVTVTGSTETNIPGLQVGVSYDVRVRACNEDKCGSSWSSHESGEPLEPLPQLAAPSVSVGSDGESIVVARYTLPSTTLHYELSLFLSDDDVSYQQVSGSAVSIPGTQGTLEHTFADLDNPHPIAHAYKVGIRPCRDDQGNTCSLTHSFSSTAYSLDEPTIDVKPLRDRRVEVSWAEDRDAGEYAVEITNPSSGNSVEWVRDTPVMIELDEMKLDETDDVSPSLGEGLADAAVFEITVTAKETGTMRQHLNREAKASIVDSPVVSVNGNSVGSPNGQALVKWRSISGATGYTIRYRKLGGDFEMPIPPLGNGRTQHTITMLDLYDVYAIQLNYSTSSGEVFSARDAYVWPSDREPDTRIETFALWDRFVPIVGGKPTYTYRVCEETFPAGNFSEDDDRDKRGAWQAIIDDAFAQWARATDDFLVVGDDGGDCTDYTGFITQIVNSINEELGVDPPDEEVVAYVEEFVDNATKRLRDLHEMDSRFSEVLMFDDVEGDIAYFANVGVFSEATSELSIDLGYTWCWENPLTRGCAPPRSVEETTDVFIRRSHFDSPSLTMPDRLDLRGSEVMFNRCTDPDGVYGTLVHEAGHALGLGHSTLNNDSVMHEFLSNLNYGVRCSPHPFDIMMFFALYQTR